MRWTGKLAIIASVVLSTLSPSSALADADRVRFLAGKLSAEDPRVRTSAALALGASNEDGAVNPLCGALKDSTEVVRQAAAVAMKRLGRQSALPCLKARLGSEGNDGVKIAIERAVESIAAAGGGAAGGDDGKMNGFYLAVAVDKFDYSNGNLRVKVKIGVFTYPGKSLLGNVDKTLTKEGVSSGDKSSEDQMLDMAAGLASEQFAQNASAFL